MISEEVQSAELVQRFRVEQDLPVNSKKGLTE